MSCFWIWFVLKLANIKTKLSAGLKEVRAGSVFSATPVSLQSVGDEILRITLAAVEDNKYWRILFIVNAWIIKLMTATFYFRWPSVGFIPFCIPTDKDSCPEHLAVATATTWSIRVAVSRIPSKIWPFSIKCCVFAAYTEIEGIGANPSTNLGIVCPVKQVPLFDILLSFFC